MPFHFSGGSQHLDVLRQNSDFVCYVVNALLQKVQTVADRGRCDGVDGTNADKVFSHLMIVAR